MSTRRGYHLLVPTLIALLLVASSAIAETDAELEKRMIEYLAALDKPKLDEVCKRLGVEPSAELQKCLCPTEHGFHYNPGSAGPCKRIGSLGGESWAPFSGDTEKWKTCIRASGRPIMDALKSYIRISQSMQQFDDTPAAPAVAGAAIPIDEMANLPKGEYKPHPVFAKLEKLKDACLPVPADDAFKPWSQSFSRSVITGRQQEVLDQLENIIDNAPNQCEAAYAGKLFIDGQEGLYSEELLGNLAWEFFGYDDWDLRADAADGFEALSGASGLASKVGIVGNIKDVQSAVELVDEQIQIDRQNRQYLEAKATFEESRGWTKVEVDQNVRSMSLGIEESRKKIVEYRTFLSDLRIELHRKYKLDITGPCDPRQPRIACDEFARELKQRSAETNYKLRTETFKAYGLELKRNLLRDVRRKLMSTSCDELMKELKENCPQ
jgi:hypothetical protein